MRAARGEYELEGNRGAQQAIEGAARERRRQSWEAVTPSLGAGEAEVRQKTLESQNELRSMVALVRSRAALEERSFGSRTLKPRSSTGSSPTLLRLIRKQHALWATVDAHLECSSHELTMPG